MKASFQNHVEVVKVLLEAKASLELKNAVSGIYIATYTTA